MSGSGSTLDKTDEVLNDFLFVSSHIDKRHSWAQRKLSPLNILLTINGPLFS